MASLMSNELAVRHPTVAWAQGVWLFDENGCRYLDGSSGAVVTAIGHAHPHVLAAMRAQAEAVTFAHRGAFTSRAAENLADRLCDLCGYDGAWLVNSGSEAVEAAMQFALQYHRERGDPARRLFLSHDRSYHGNTLGGLSLSGHARRAVATGLVHDFAVLPTPASSADTADSAAVLLAAARSHFQAAGGALAGVFVEPVGGATLGATALPTAYLRGLQELCTEFGALFMTDEVMSGLGRTGTVLALDEAGIRADIAVIGKGLGAGYTPIAATLLSDRVVRAVRDGSGRVLGGHTYAANPLSAAVGSAVLDVMEAEDVLGNVQRVGPVLRAGLVDLARRHELVADVRGRGFLHGVELHPDDRPTGATAQLVVAAAMAQGIVVYRTTGGFNDAFLVAPPLISSRDDIAFLLRGLDAALSETGPGLTRSGVPRRVPAATP